MRLNKFLAQNTSLSRRAADTAIKDGRVTINGRAAGKTTPVNPSDQVALDNQPITPTAKTATIILNKPEGFVVSRNGQGSRTIYDLIPKEYQLLNPVGRLDKNSSGLLLLTNNGDLANQLTHPKYQKTKIYQITLNQPLQPLHQQMISDYGIKLEDGVSKLGLTKLSDNQTDWQVTMHEGRNRQIRRTFQALGYEVIKLHRTNFGDYTLGNLASGEIKLTD